MIGSNLDYINAATQSFSTISKLPQFCGQDFKVDWILFVIGLEEFSLIF